MKKALILVLVLVSALALIQGAAFAKSIEGKVADVDATANTLTVSSTDETGMEAKSVLSVSDATTFSGVASLGELKVDDKVTVEAEEDAATSSWKATSVTVKTAAPAPAM